MKKNRSKKKYIFFLIIVFFNIIGVLKSIYGINASLSIAFIKLVDEKNINILNNFKLIAILITIFSLVVCISLMKRYKKFPILWIIYSFIQFAYFFIDFLIFKQLSQNNPLLNFRYISGYHQLIFFCLLTLVSLIYLYRLIKGKTLDLHKDD